MIKFKKFLAAAMTGMMMLGAVGVSAPAVTVKAAEDAQPAITAIVDYKDFVLKVDTPTAKKISYITLEVLKDNTGSKVSASYTYKAEAEKTSVDLSFLKISKKAYIRVYNTLKPEEKSAVITVNAQPEKLSMKFVDGKGTFEESFTAKVGKTALTLDNAGVAKLEYRPLYAADWKTFGTANDAFAKLTASRIAGTTWVVRQVATGSAVAGTEIKVKIPAMAKAPKVTVDYVKNSVKLPKGSEYFVIKADGTEKLKDSKKVAVSAAVAAAPEKILENLGIASNDAIGIMNEGFTLVVNTAKTDKKAASQQAFVNIPAVTAAAVNASGTAVTVGSNKLTAESLGAGLKLTATGANFEYSLDGTKWAKVAKDKSVVAKIKDNTKEVLVRQAGVKPAKDGSGAALPSLTAKLTYTKPVAGITLKLANGNAVKADTVIEVSTGSAISLTSLFTAEVTNKDGKADTTAKVTYSVSGGSAEAKIENTSLDISKEAKGTVLTITAKVTKGDAKDATATVKLKVK